MSGPLPGQNGHTVFIRCPSCPVSGGGTCPVRPDPSLLADLGRCDMIGRAHLPRQPGARGGRSAEERAVVADDGRALRLTVYRGAEPLAAVDLDPVRALALVQDLLDAARRRLVRCTISPT
jgi:hypothetical protein